MALAAIGAVAGVGAQTLDVGANAQPKQTPPPLKFNVPVVFVLSLSSEATTNADITVQLARQIGHYANGRPRHNSTFVPEGTWTLNDFINQCAEDPDHVRGAIVVLPASYENHNNNYLLMIRNESSLAFTGMVVSCKKIPPGTDPGTPRPAEAAGSTAINITVNGGAITVNGGAITANGGASPAAKPTPKPSADSAVEWVSDPAEGTYGHSEIQFLPLAAMTSVYLAFAPQKVYQTTTTHILPTPPTPLPAGGYDSQISTVSSSTLNSSGTATLQNNVVSAAGIAALLVGRGGTIEHYTVHAAEDAAYHFVQQFKEKCGKNWDVEPSPEPTVTHNPYVAHMEPSDIVEVVGKTEADQVMGNPTPPPDVLPYCQW